ncbi:MAG TPA: CRTAC1 family protein [bacterium]|nr:CRTAC1 family protein [bacterium]
MIGRRRSSLRPHVAAGRLAAGVLAAGVLSAAGSPVSAQPVFRDATAAAGIDFLHSNGATGDKQCYEQMGSGACFLDYDGDGRLDLYLVTCIGPNRLFENEGDGKFAEVPGAAGLDDEGYGMAAVAADVDNDGDPDVVVTNFGPNHLYRNDGGRFRLIENAGIEDPRWGCSATFLDYDRDGFLDLFITNYVQVADPDTNVCHTQDGLRLYCPPRRYPREEDLLYRNRGDGTFENVTAPAGIAGFEGRGLGVVATDFDRDGWTDIYVANDLDPNFLYHNNGDGTFQEMGLLAGASHSENGSEESGMGLAAGDYDNDGWVDLFVTNFINETNTLYHNEGGVFFLDESATSGLGPESLPWVGWGTCFFDFDRDGFRDVLVVNGHTESDAEASDPTTSWKQPDYLYRNRGDGGFDDVTAEAAPVLLAHRAGRGAAFGDPDDDGDIDVVIVHQNDAALYLENTGTPGNHWIGIRGLLAGGVRDAVGARVAVWSGGLRGTQEIQAGSSYLSCNDPRVLFGLGESAAVDSVTVDWPDGSHESFPGRGTDRYHVLIQGEGEK